MKSGRRTAWGLLLGLLTLWSAAASAGWETGAKAGFDTNVNREIDGGESDTFLGAYAAFVREPTGGTRTDWTVTATAEGAAYADFSDLSYVAATVAPGAVLFYGGVLTVAAAPFLQAKSVRDSDQSAVAFGGRLSLRQRLRRSLYLGEYYAYTDSRAEVETFSFTEHAAGIFLGVNWTAALFSEIGYEFSRGDSFRSLDGAQAPAGENGPGGRHRRFSEAFGAEVVRERVTRHAVGVNAGIDWTKSLFSQAGYTFTRTDGDLGTSRSHSGFLGLGYRF